MSACNRIYRRIAPKSRAPPSFTPSERKHYTDIYESLRINGINAQFTVTASICPKRNCAASTRLPPISPTAPPQIFSSAVASSIWKKYERAAARPVTVGLGTDVGGGTSFSMLQTMSEAYKMAQLRGISLAATQSYYLATLGSADALGRG